jgi:hypothetical protein
MAGDDRAGGLKVMAWQVMAAHKLIFFGLRFLLLHWLLIELLTAHVVNLRLFNELP